MELEYGRTLPPELHALIHQCLPLPNAIHVLVNVSKTFLNNKDRMLRNVQQLRTSLNEYIGTLVDDGEDREELRITDDLQWKPEMDALFRYGTWLTSTRKFEMLVDNSIAIIGTPNDFVEKLLLHMAYSRSTQMMLQHVEMSFGMAAIPIPTFMKPLLNKKKEHYQIGRRIFFESVQLETDNGQILHIFDGQFTQYEKLSSELRLFVMNKMDGNNWFRIIFGIDPSKEFISQFEFSKWNMQSFDVANFVNEEGRLDNYQIEENGNKLEAKNNIYWNRSLDIILRRGAGFSQFRHFTMKQYTVQFHPWEYFDFLISYISNTNHPEDFLESIDINLKGHRSTTIHKIWKYYRKGIEEGYDQKKFHILSANTTKSEKGCLNGSSGGPKIVKWKKKLEFTLANIPTNGAYVFDVEVQFGKEGFKQIAGIKIQKRKNGEIVELKCKDQIGQGEKKKATNDDGEDEDEPTCSGKIMKK